MNYLLDTDACIYWLNGVRPLFDKVTAVGLHPLATSTVTVAELYFGAYNSARVADNIARIETFVQNLTVLPLDDATLKTFGRLKAELRKRGQPIADFDLLIASSALAASRTLITNNVRHYARIPDLLIENWMPPSPP